MNTGANCRGEKHTLDDLFDGGNKYELNAKSELILRNDGVGGESVGL